MENYPQCLNCAILGYIFSSAGNALILEIMLILEQSLQIVVFNKAN